MTQQFPPQWQPPSGQPQWAPPPATPEPPKQRPSFWRSKKGAAVLLGGGLLTAFVLDAANNSPAPAPSYGAAPPSWSMPVVRPSLPTITASARPAGPLTSFGPGTYEIGTGPDQIAPGKYKTAGPAAGDFGGSCYWARLKNTDGELASIIANGNAQGPTTVTIGKNDAAFETRCTWTKAA